MTEGRSSPPTAPRIRLARPDFDEREVEAIRAVLRSGILTNGPQTAAFEARFAERHQVEHAVAVANGTVALAAAFIALGIGPGDEVIVPSLTFISSATSVLHVGATPVFADIAPDTFNLDPVDTARRLTPRTRAILPVHYGGQPADMDELSALAHDAGVALVEDAAEAHGALYRGRPVGGLGEVAIFSFTGTKNISMGEGGVLTTTSGEVAARVRLLRNHGQSALYRHDSVGYNWRLTEMQAAMGSVQLEKLDDILRRKRRNAESLRSHLEGTSGLRLPVEKADRDHTYMLYTMLVDDGRDSVLATLNDAGIESRVYFPPAHTQSVFGGHRTMLPVTDDVSRRMFSVPFHSLLTSDELTEIASTVVQATSERRARSVGA